jgi:hydrogenase expression/formation protein HypC
MCLAVPLKVIEVNHLVGTVDLSGTSMEVSLMLLPEEVKTGDYVLVHAGFAIEKVDEEAAMDALDFFGKIVESVEPGNQGLD